MSPLIATTTNNATMSSAIDLAIAELNRQAVPNYSGTAKPFQVDRTTLRRRFLGKQLSLREAGSESTQKLTIANIVTY
jgi:hypothetical protein